MTSSSSLSFYDAIINNDEESLKRALEVNKVDLNAKFGVVRNRIHADLCPVHLVACRGNFSLLRYLIQAGVDVKQTTSTLHRQAVHYAALRHQLSCLQMLINAGGQIDAKDTFGNTPLHYASEDGDIGLLTLLLNNSADVNAQDITNKTPLMKATRNGKISAVKRLLAAGCNVNLKDRNEDTALHFACRHGSTETTNMLLKAEARIDAQNHWGLTPLMEAVSYNQREVVALLIRRRCDLYKRDFRTGDTALHIAVKKNYADIAELLLTAGKWYIEYNFNNFGESFVHDAVVYNRVELMRLFVTHNYNFEYSAKKLPGGGEKSPFQLALERGHMDMARILSQVCCFWYRGPSTPHSSAAQNVRNAKYSELEEVKSLRSWCRKTIRKQLEFNVVEKVMQLPLPEKLKQFLLLCDLDWTYKWQFQQGCSTV